MNLETRLATLFKIKYPIMSAPMSMHSGAELAVAVTKAGGVGMFGAIGAGGEVWLKDQLDQARSLLADQPFGIGFITFMMDSFPGLFDIAVQEKVPVMAFSFTDPASFIDRAKNAGSIVVCQVRTMDQAREAVAAGTDILVAQGNEAGGHTGQTNMMPFLQRVLDTYPDIPILAAGGIGSGRNLAAVLAAGADGAWIGTPLLATPECIEVSDEYKARLIAAIADDTIYTPLFDIANHQAFGRTPWPEGIAARVLRNQFVKDWQNKMDQVTSTNESLMAQYRDGVENKNLDVSVVYAGESVDSVTRIRPAATVIQDICEDARARLS